MLRKHVCQLVRRLMLAVAVGALAVGTVHGTARAETPLAPTVTISTNAPSGGVVGGTNVTGTVTVHESSRTGALGPIGVEPHAASSSISGLVTTPIRATALLPGVTVALGTPCFNFFGSCPASPVTVPASVDDVHPGQAKTFTIITSPVSAESDVAIVASYGGAVGTTVLKVVPPRLESLSAAYHEPLLQGDSFTLTPCLNGPAPSGGEDAQWTDNNWALLGGEGGGEFGIDPGASCGHLTFTAAATGSVTIKVSVNGVSKQATLTVTAPSGGTTGTSGTGGSGPAALQSILINGIANRTVQSSADSPVTVTVAVALTAPAPSGGALIAINAHGPVVQGDNTAPYLGPVPDSLTIMQGQASSSFQLQVYGCPSYSSGTYCDTAIDASYLGVTMEAVVLTQ